MSSFPP